MALDSSETTGRAIGLVIMAGIALAPLAVASRSKSRSERLACFSVFAGLSLFIFPEQILPVNAVEHAWVFIADGLVRAALGVAGIVWCIMALRARKVDQGAGYVGPIVGALFSVFHILLAVSLILMTFLINGGLPSGPPSAAAAATSDGPWLHSVAECGFEMQLPSRSWTSVKENVQPGKAVAEFVCDHAVRTKMLVALDHIQDEADIAVVKRTIRERFIKGQHVVPREQDGVFPDGSRFTFFWLETGDPDSGAASAGALGLVWLPGQNLCVKMLSETPHASLSRLWGDAVAARHRKLALWIAESVKSTVAAGQADAGANGPME